MKGKLLAVVSLMMVLGSHGDGLRAGCHAPASAGDPSTAADGCADPGHGGTHRRPKRP